MVENKGFDPTVLNDYRRKVKDSGKLFVPDPDDERSDEYVHFYFIGKYNNQEVVYDAVLYTLRLHYESELFEIAEHKAAMHFPEYKKINYDEDENGNFKTLDSLEEEIGLFMAEVIMELEEDESVKVQEHVEMDVHADFGVGLDIGLHLEKISDQTIDNFIRQFNAGKVELDKTFYTYQVSDVNS